jgi:histidyl-tRNA synthetase
MLKFEHIRRKGIEIFKKHGYQEVQPNILEHEELFQRSLGEASEIIQKV